MNPHTQQLINYLQTYPDWQSQRETLRQQLVQAGWDPAVVDEAFHGAHSIASSTAAFSPETASRPPVAAKRARPPLAAQIFFAFSVIGLLLGILGVIVTINMGLGAADLVLGGTHVGIITSALLETAYYIALFWLVIQMRRLKKWALVALTATIVSSFINELINWLQVSSIIHLLNGPVNHIEVLVYGGAAVLLAILWTKNRHSFH